MTGTFIYILQSVMTGFISYALYKNAKLENLENTFIFISRFFKYLSVYLFSFAILSFLSVYMSDVVLSIFIITTRVFLIVAFIYLLRTPIFSRFEFIKKRLKVLDALIIVSIVTAITLIVRDFQPVEVINGVIIQHYNFYAAQFISLPSLIIGIAAFYSFIKYSRVDFKREFAKNTYILSLAAILVALGDTLVTIAHDKSTSLNGSIIAVVSYALFILVILINYYQNKKKAISQPSV